ncbi:hypothetical protein C8D88_107124 [Lentzea atacamensis]|uniref:Uncharacterized protein n=1 Tax=Lentzea atacamensis TaxID=531938 RepID=A0A316HUN9_9PSEU|nr:hypothetical protein [Lentzea atacamensis]PWK84917.1 hypothetical protein C8D88_107124 [Lentzea atacamensis]RAS65929.1 hypothetical protein C8D87_104480 [Lentzea atacamensis]
MEPKTNTWPRRRFLTTAGAAALGGLGLSVFGDQRAAGAAGPTATMVSYLDTARSAHDKMVLMVDGKPFFHNGIQYRYEKRRYSYGWNDTQLKSLLGVVAQDGSGGSGADALWALEPVSTGGYRLNNQNAGSEYPYATSAGEVRWNTGSTDAATVWTFEPK